MPQVVTRYCCLEIYDLVHNVFIDYCPVYDGQRQDFGTRITLMEIIVTVSNSFISNADILIVVHLILQSKKLLPKLR